MALFKVVLELDLNAENPLEAAKKAEEWIKHRKSSWMYYVQEDDTTELFSVDTGEDDEEAVLPVNEPPVFFN